MTQARLAPVVLALFFAGAASALPFSAALAEPVTVTILHVNDLDRMEEQKGQGGVARLVGAIKAEKARAENVIVTHGGDAISPSLLSGFDQGAHMIALFNSVGFDAMAVGNHEFDFGPAIATERFREATFPILSANAIDADGEVVDGAQASILIERAGYTFGIFGLTAASTAVKSSPGSVTFLDPVEVAAEQAKALRDKGADVVIALAHTDLGEDAALFRAGSVDLILSGDDHILSSQYDGKTALVESGSQADYVTVVTLTLDRVKARDGSPRVTWEPSFRTINTRSVEPDPKMAAEVQVFLDKLSNELDVEIGTTATAMDSTRPVIRAREAAIGNLIADAMRKATEADLALTNGGGIRAERAYAPGTKLTRRDIQSELPFGNKTVTLRLTGAEIIAALENGFGRIEDMSGRFPHVSGMRVVYDPSAKPGSRVVSVMVGDAPLDENRTYVLATNDFLARGGDGYDVFVDAPRVIDEIAGRLMAAQVIEYVEAAGTVSPAVEGRLQIK